MPFGVTKSFYFVCAYLCLGQFSEVGAAGAGAKIWQLDQDYVEQSLTKEQGLPDDSVKALHQDRNGYIWVATQYGLARFDGFRVAVFNHANAPAMSNDNCLALAEDSEGALWIATPTALLRLVSGRISTEWDWKGLGTDSLVTLCPGRYGGVWLGNEQGLNFIHDGSRKHYDEVDGLLASQVTAVFADSSGLVWVGTKKGLQSLSVADGQFKEWRPAGLVPGLRVVSLAGSGTNNLWVLFTDSTHPKDRVNLFRLDDRGWSVPWTNRLGNAGRKPFLSLDRQGGCLVCLYDDIGWMRFREGKPTTSTWLDLLVAHIPICSLEDRDGNVWVGTESHGLHRLAPRHVRTLSTLEGLIHNNVRAVLQSQDGTIWIGTDEGVSSYQNGKFRQFSKATGLAEASVRSLAEDAWGRIWIGTSGGGLNVISSENIFTVRLPGDSLDNKIRTIYASESGILWIGTLRALHRLKLQPDTFRGQRGDSPLEAAHLANLTTFTNLGGFNETDVRSLIEDSRGILWAGTSGQGIYKVQGDDVSRICRANALSSDFVWAFHEDREGTMWVGTDRGLNRCRAGQITEITTAQGLPDNLINSILEDNAGHFWIGHDHGIYRVPKTALDDVSSGKIARVECVPFDEEDGLLSVETNGQTSQPAACKTRDGHLWFSTTKGVAVFDPLDPPDLTNPPPVVIEQVRANGEPILDNDPSGHPRPTGSLSRSTSQSSKVLLPPGSARILEFEYTANTFNAAQKTHFKYRLEGLDKDWIDAGNSRKAYYANLDPGDHFRVIAANKHSVWNETGASLTFYYSPFFYQTAWFFILVGMCLVSAGFAAYRWRIKAVRKVHQLRQEAELLRERERIGKDLHDGLGANLTHLSLLADLAGRDPQEANGEHLRKLSDSTRDAVHTLKEIIWASNPGDETLDGVTARICQTAEEFLGAAGIRCRFDLPTKLPKSRLSSEQRRNLLLVAKEALNNVVKHSSASELRICAFVVGSVFTLTIEDNGNGFVEGEMIWKGHGLANMRHRAEVAGGRFELESRTGSGTSIRINLLIPEH